VKNHQNFTIFGLNLDLIFPYDCVNFNIYTISRRWYNKTRQSNSRKAICRHAPQIIVSRQEVGDLWGLTLPKTNRIVKN
jgi:hypothetical protein